jgi:hypothetical protein
VRDGGLEPPKLLDLNEATLPVCPIPHYLVGDGGLEPPELLFLREATLPFAQSPVVCYGFYCTVSVISSRQLSSDLATSRPGEVVP